MGNSVKKRNIPAYAGKTPKAPLCSCLATEHPRVCGENIVQNVICFYHTGTSPRMRGKRRPASAHPRPNRNIPAYAGKTLSTIFSTFSITEHPRVCGENASGDSISHSAKGTSPRMRGKPEYCFDYVFWPRNIPAYAGKTRTHTDWWRTTQEHPRVCGENFHEFSLRFFSKGTSPRMRGKHLHVCKVFVVSGNIPAYAGKTLVLTDIGEKF